MPKHLFDEISNWAEGVNTSAAPDQIPAGSSPRSRNAHLLFIGDATALVSKRAGIAELNNTPVTGSPRLWGFQFKKKTGSSYNLLVSDTGRLDQLNTNNTLSTLNATAFTSGDHPPTFAVANDLCFIVNDVDKKKFDGSTVTSVGISRPAAPTATAAAGGAMAAGVWDVALTYYNSLTGNESSRSDFTSVTLGAGNLKINVSWLAPTDPQVTHVRVYIRQQSAGANAYLAIAGATPAADATHKGYAPATLATVLDISATQYGAFAIIAPSTTANDPPAAGLTYPVWHASRLFLFDSGNAYYSNFHTNTPFPEAFDPNNVQPINPNDGDVIVGAKSYKGRLYIFKKFSVWELDGTDPNSWTVNLISDSYGLSSMQSLVEADGTLYWWTSSNAGLVSFDGARIVPLGQRFISATVNAQALNHLNLDIVSGVVDEANSLVLMAVPEFGGSRNTILIPFNYRLGRFDSEFFNPLDVNSMWQVETSEDTKAVYLGGYAGQAFQWWSGISDGVPAGSTESGAVTGATSTTLTDSAATFPTTGGKLVDRYVYAISSDGLSVQRRRISTNTGTQLTVSAAWDVTPNTTYTYIVGGIDWQVDTPWMIAPSGFVKKRFEFLHLETETDDLSVTLSVDLFTSKNATDPKKTKTVLVGGTGGVYDAATSLYDVTSYASGSTAFSKIRCGCTGKAWRARIRNLQAGKSITLSKLLMQSVMMNTKH